MAELTKDELRHLRAGHVALWTWLAETGKYFKYEWPGWVWNGGQYKKHPFDCFACAAAGYTNSHDRANASRCISLCPIKWTDATTCYRKKAEYDLWTETEFSQFEKRKRLAAKIATMWPEVPDADA